MSPDSFNEQADRRDRSPHRLGIWLVVALTAWAVIMAAGVLLKQQDWARAAMVAIPILIMAGLVAWGVRQRERMRGKADVDDQSSRR